jgi:hypothetical protein
VLLAGKIISENTVLDYVLLMLTLLEKIKYQYRRGMWSSLRLILGYYIMSFQVLYSPIFPPLNTV